MVLPLKRHPNDDQDLRLTSEKHKNSELWLCLMGLTYALDLKLLGIRLDFLGI